MKICHTSFHQICTKTRLFSFDISRINAQLSWLIFFQVSQIVLQNIKRKPLENRKTWFQSSCCPIWCWVIYNHGGNIKTSQRCHQDRGWLFIWKCFLNTRQLFSEKRLNKNGAAILACWTSFKTKKDENEEFKLHLEQY